MPVYENRRIRIILDKNADVLVFLTHRHFCLDRFPYLRMEVLDSMIIIKEQKKRRNHYV